MFALPFVSISIAIADPIIKGIGIPLTNLTPPPRDSYPYWRTVSYL